MLPAADQTAEFVGDPGFFVNMVTYNTNRQKDIQQCQDAMIEIRHFKIDIVKRLKCLPIKVGQRMRKQVFAILVVAS
jgi:hypothetical protein